MTVFTAVQNESTGAAGSPILVVMGVRLGSEIQLIIVVVSPDVSPESVSSAQSKIVHPLSHMNGRIYDAELARFVQADPIVQAPTYTQSFNRYSYVMNNPLKFIDPSGYTASGLRGDFSDTQPSDSDFDEAAGNDYFHHRRIVDGLIAGAEAVVRKWGPRFEAFLDYSLATGVTPEELYGPGYALENFDRSVDYGELIAQLPDGVSGNAWGSGGAFVDGSTGTTFHGESPILAQNDSAKDVFRDDTRERVLDELSPREKQNACIALKCGRASPFFMSDCVLRSGCLEGLQEDLRENLRAPSDPSDRRPEWLKEIMRKESERRKVEKGGSK